jgi:hypothetical protein
MMTAERSEASHRICLRLLVGLNQTPNQLLCQCLRQPVRRHLLGNRGRPRQAGRDPIDSDPAGAVPGGGNTGEVGDAGLGGWV